MATAQLGTLLRHIHRLAAGSLPDRTDRQLLDDFSASQDEAAFAALVARHGPLVLRVCRRVLHHEQDAEDAFQATFLVLARHTGSIRKRAALAQWLHGVAYRTAMEAKRRAARRRKHEARLRAGRGDCPSLLKGTVSLSGPTWDDVQAVLDEEIQRLPQAFRAAFVLCVLEGKSGPEAAALLGVKEGTVSSRLTRARQRLRARLARRGIQLAALLAALSLADNAGQGALPATLAGAALRCGLSVAAGGTAVGRIPSHVAALAAGVTRAMFLTKAKIATAILLTVSLLAAAGTLTRQALRAQEAPPAAQATGTPAKAEQPAARQSRARARAAVAANTVTYRGRVLAPDGRPVPGAKLYLSPAWGDPEHEPAASPRATAGTGGRFDFTAAKSKHPDEPAIVTAAAPKYGVAWADVPAGGKRDGLTLRLVDDVPITGRIVDLEGKPVPGATLHVLDIYAAANEDLGPWLRDVKARKGLCYQLENQHFGQHTIAVGPRTMTDAAGRFRLTGIGRNRLVRVRLDGPTIVSQYLYVLTRPGETLQVLEHEDRAEYGEQRVYRTYYGAAFRHVAAPSKPILGVVRDKDTKKPLGGVSIRSYTFATRPNFLQDIVHTTTDAHGRYRLTGMPKGKGNQVIAVPASDVPYHISVKAVPDTAGLAPVAVDFELKRGIWIEGRITDKVTGKPVPASVEYFSLYRNPHLRDYPGFDSAVAVRTVAAKEDGSYRVPGISGPGLMVVWQVGHYLRVPDRDDEFAAKEAVLNKGTAPYWLLPYENYTAFAYLDATKGTDPVKRGILLDPGWTFTGTVLGPDGKPLSGVRGFGFTGPRWWEREPLKTAGFTVRGYNPHRPREVLLQHLGKGLVGIVPPPKCSGGSVTVRMTPGAAVRGRLLDADGWPRAGARLEVLFQPKEANGGQAYPPDQIETDREGRFRVGALIPGYKYSLFDGKGEVRFGKGLRGGETKDLGDVQTRHE
jgi:RNA polymerase sigma factor (sigma-70 family)